MTAMPLTSIGAEGSSIAPPGPTEKICGAPRGGSFGGGGVPTGPSCQRLVSCSTSSRSSPRTRMWISSPSRTSVEPRGGIAWPSRTITLTRASRGSPSSRTTQPIGDDVAAEAADPA
jgi:hypothetical protein